MTKPTSGKVNHRADDLVYKPDKPGYTNSNYEISNYGITKLQVATCAEKQYKYEPSTHLIKSHEKKYGLKFQN